MFALENENNKVTQLSSSKIEIVRNRGSLLRSKIREFLCDGVAEIDQDGVEEPTGPDLESNAIEGAGPQVAQSQKTFGHQECLFDPPASEIQIGQFSGRCFRSWHVREQCHASATAFEWPVAYDLNGTARQTAVQLHVVLKQNQFWP